MTTMRAPAAWRRRLAPSCGPQPAAQVRRPDRADPRLGDRRRRRARRPVRPAPDGLRRRHGVRALAGVHRGLHPRAGAADVRQHAHRGVGDRPADDRAARGGPRASSTGRSTAATTTSSCSAAPGRPARSTSSSACSSSTPRQRPVVFIGPYEHHSNELPWRESVADVVTIREDADGRVDLEHLEHELRRHADRPLKIGSFSAASNVTGIVTDVDQVAIALHRHGALSCWDYAAAGPYLPIDMNAAPDIPNGRSPTRTRSSSRRTSSSAAPARPACSSPSAGCCATASRRCRAAGRSCSSARPGTPTTPTRRSARRAARRRSSSRSAPGSCSRSRRRSAPTRSAAASTTSRAARCARGPRTRRSRSSATPSSSGWRSSRSACATRAGLLHANFVVAVLSDLFGIQARSGCFCAGPYIHRMYPIDDEWSRRMDAEVGQGPPGRQARVHAAELQLLHQRDGLRTTSSTPSTWSPTRAGSCCRCTASIPTSGLWQHRDGAPDPPPSLRDFAAALDGAPARLATAPESVLAGQLEAAREIIAAVAGRAAGRARCTTRRSARSSSGSAGSRSRARGSRSC